MSVTGSFKDNDNSIRLTLLREGDSFIFKGTPYLLIRWVEYHAFAQCTNLTNGFQYKLESTEAVIKADFNITVERVDNKRK